MAAENALSTSADAAVQVYIPESSSFGFQIWSVPSTSTLDLPTGSSSFFLAQVIVGLGSPVAWQRTVMASTLLDILGRFYGQNLLKIRGIRQVYVFL